ncbi:hypothetical protein WKV44_04365 [Spirochaetia bacterium 38H-sp]|uniref:Uncharacterized protein n=1 Tax=Rarispira pelagica TaxID=3141764 RepID=A0ABU9UAS5_9SPIR
MDIRTTLKQNNIEYDDIRWYLSLNLAMQLLQYKDKEEELAKLIWSGKLEDKLYDMTETFLSMLEQKKEEGRLDEPALREIISEINLAKDKRKLME